MKNRDNEKAHIRDRIEAVTLVVILILAGTFVIWNVIRDDETNTLQILTTYDVRIQEGLESLFLNTTFAQENRIVDIIWESARSISLDLQLGLMTSGDFDIYLGVPEFVHSIIDTSIFHPLNSSFIEGSIMNIPDTIAGVESKGYDPIGNPVWCSISFNVFSIGISVNQIFMDEHNMSVPQTLDELASMELSLSVLGDYPIALWLLPMGFWEVLFFDGIMMNYGWNYGWNVLSRIAANAMILDYSAAAFNETEDAVAGITPSVMINWGAPQYTSPYCEYRHLKNQSVVMPDALVIASASEKKYLAEGFLDFILSSSGQSIWLEREVSRMPMIIDEASYMTGSPLMRQVLEVFNRTLFDSGVNYNTSLSVRSTPAYFLYCQAVLNDSHNELVDCWSKIVSAFRNGSIDYSQVEYLSELMTALITITDPITETQQMFTLEYALEVSNLLQSNNAYYSVYRDLWREGAITQYEEVSNLL